MRTATIMVVSTCLLIGSGGGIVRAEPGSRPAHQATEVLAYRTAGRAAGAAAAPVVAFENVDVLPMDGRRILRRQTVLVEDGSVVAIGRRVAIPLGARVVAGRGRFLMPGLIDTHVHIAYLSDLTLFLANGVTTVREMWGSEGHLELRDAIAAGIERGPSMWVASPGLVGAPGFWPRETVVRTAAEGAAAVRRFAASGYNGVKLYEALGREPFVAAAGVARELQIPILGHTASAVGLDAALGAGPRSLSHLLRFLGGTGLSEWAVSPTETRLRKVAERLREAGVASEATLTVLHRLLTPGEVAGFVASEPALRYVHPARLQSWIDLQHALPAATRESILANQSRMVAMIERVGAAWAIGTDAGFRFTVPGFTYADELQAHVSAGIPIRRVLEAATVAGAALLGLGDEVGKVAVGYRADLLLLDANPLVDVTNVARRVGVMRRGVWYPEAELETALADIARLYGQSARD